MTSLSPSDLGEEACQGNDGDFMYSEDQFLSSQSDTLTNLSKEVLAGSECTSMSQDAFEAVKTVKPMEKLEPFMATDEETGLLCAPGSDVNSPRDIVSPSAGSSPFSAMESDGEGIETGMDDASLSGIGDTSFHGANGFFNSTYTTTPCASSSACDDDYESTGSRKKRRKRREMHHPGYHSNVNGGISSLQFARAENQGPWQQADTATSPFSPPTCTQKMNFNFAENSSRRSSSGMTPSQITKTEFSDENAKRPRTCGDALDNEEMLNTSGNSIPVKVEMPATIDTPVSSVKSGVRRHHAHHRTSGSQDEEQILHKQYPRKAGPFELRMLAQPESQHRARYLTEGSRGPVKDGTQQGFPKVELVGYNGPATLQVFVATDSGKVKPHGFYQACKVTGRNTSTCEEIEIEGTKVIEIPFKQDAMILSIDCVGILKLRNTDVEVRTGIRNQKRNQSVRLLFRVSVPSANSTGIVTLQIASTRISCTQPLGQPEITKKSIDRCSVDGGIEMFIIGKNFHRGTKVIYQDPEEPNDTQWCEEGEVDKDTFHQSHMVVRVPPYHDLDIQKPVNVQLLVEFQDKRCEPHSFTYTPRQKDPEPPKEDTKKVTQPQGNVGPPNNIESALGGILDGPIDKKFLITLFSKLLAGGITAQPDSPGSSMAHTPEPTNSEAQTQPPLLNAFSNPAFMESAAPLLQGILHPPLQTQTVVEVVPEADVKMPNPVSNFSNPFANFQFALQPSKMSFTQALSNAEPTLLSNAAPVSTPVAQVFNPIQVPVPAGPTPVSQMIFNPAPIPAVAPQVSQINFNPAPATGVATNPMSQISFNTSLCAGISPPVSQISFNHQPSVGIANLPVLVATHPIPTAAVSVPISQVNHNPMIATGLSNTVSPSVGSVAMTPTGPHVQVKSETSIPEMMLNVTNTQTNPVMVSSSNLQTTFPGIQQVSQIQPSFTPPTQDPTPPPTIISPVSQPLLYNSFYAANPSQGSTAPAFSNVPVSFVNVSAPQGGLVAQSLPQVVTFTAASVVSTPSQQAQTYQATNFQVSLPQQLQQQVFTSAASNQIFVKQPQVIGNAPAASHNLGVLNHSPVVPFTAAQSVALPAGMNQASAQFQSPFVEKKSDDYSSNQVSQNPMIQTIQSPKEVGSHQFSVTPQQPTQVNNNFSVPNQQPFSVTVVDQPMQQDHHTVIGQGQPQLHQQSASFGTTNQQQQQFSAEIKDQVMPQQSNIVASPNQYTLVGQAQQQQTVFNAQPQIQISVSGQQQQMELFPMATQNNQAATQQQPTAQIVHIQQVAQNPPIVSQPQRPQDNQMHVDPFVEPQSVVNLQAQQVGLSQNNVFTVQQTGMQPNAPVQQPMEDVIPTPVHQTIDHQMKDAGQPQIPQQQQQQQQQQSFHIQHQPVIISVASEVTSPPLRQQGTGPTQATVTMQPASVYQNIQQPANVTIVSTGTSLPEQNFASPQQVCSPVAALQTSGIITPAMPVQQIFQSQLPTAQHIPVESPNTAQMQAQHYQSPEAVTKSPPPAVVPNMSQQQFQAMPPPQQQALPNTAQMQTPNNYIYQDNRGAQIQQQQQQENANAGETNAALQQHQRRNPATNIIVTNQLEPRSPDVFALTKLLQSIDGSELAAITGEDVQRHCQ